MNPESHRIRLPLIIPGILAAVLIVGCQGRDDRYEIDASRAQAMINSDHPPLVIDVRTKEEYDGELGHISGARLIPIDVFKDSIDALSDYRDSTLIVVCKVGYRSGLGARELRKDGFSKVYNLAGGMEAWRSRESSGQEKPGNY